MHVSSGAPLAQASVVLTVRNQPQQTALTDSDGRFRFNIESDSAPVQIRATAPGFATVSSIWRAGDGPVKFTLAVGRVDERVTVTATGSLQQPNVAELDRRRLAESGALTVDENLRQIPGFKLFRRSPAWSANPTTQGVSLRGIGASAASRALVLKDGIPVNDPYGSWIYWGRFVQAALDRVEVVQGGESNIYGSEAMGGVVSLFQRDSTVSFLTLDSSLANQATPSASAMGSFRVGSWSLIGTGEGFRTNGYIPTPANLRGTVDAPASSENRGGEITLEHSSPSGGRAFLAASYYHESRHNGTVVQRNRANLRQLRTGIDFNPRAIGSIGIRVFGGSESLFQTFSSVAADRNSENLTRLQGVPASNLGSSVLWSRTAGSRQMLLAGLDTSWVDGASRERAFSRTGAETSLLYNGGTQQVSGFYGEDRVRLGSKLLLSVGGRVDHWSNTDGISRTTALPPATQSTSIRYPDRSETAFSPRAAAQYAFTNRFATFVSASRSFRAPTLDELYRSFQVGNVLTRSNAFLKAERLSGGEAGISAHIGQRFTIRGSYFYYIITNPVTSVTIATTGTTITRERQNLGRTRSQGVDLWAETSLAPSLSFEFAYQLAKTVVLSSPANPALIGNWLPQVPQNTATAGIRYTPTKTVVLNLRGRYNGQQFDDDLNALPLAGFFSMDAFASHQLSRDIEIYIAGENLLNRRWEVARTPVLQLGPPVMARAGIRLNLGRRN